MLLQQEALALNIWESLTGPADMNDSHSKHISGSSWDPCWKMFVAIILDTMQIGPTVNL